MKKKGCCKHVSLGGSGFPQVCSPDHFSEVNLKLYSTGEKSFTLGASACA